MNVQALFYALAAWLAFALSIWVAWEWFWTSDDGVALAEWVRRYIKNW